MKIFVFEYISGGGLSAQILPESLVKVTALVWGYEANVKVFAQSRNVSNTSFKLSQGHQTCMEE